VRTQGRESIKAVADRAAAQAAEGARLTALHALRILDTPAEERFDRITRIAARLFGMPIALLNLIDADRQWTKSCVGLDVEETRREDSFCGRELAGTEVLLVSDATCDPRFADNPSVTGSPGIRFYAGAVIRAADGQPLGRLCVLDTVAHDPAGLPLAALTDLAAWVELELHRGRAPAPAGDPAALALMQERFLAVAGHELRTPLTLIRGYSEELLDPAGDPLTSDQHESVAAIVRGSTRLHRLVEDLQLVLELDAGRVRLEREPVALALLATEAREALASDAESAGVSVVLDVAPEATVVADQRRLALALGALLRNAIAWSPPGGVVRIATAAGPAELRLTVSDEGPGLPPGEGAALGRRFRRLRGMDPREGAGLGLTIARGLAELHGGRLEADVEGPGATVSIIMPAAGPA
jgi:signal transduction histidine kinase